MYITCMGVGMSERDMNQDKHIQYTGSVGTELVMDKSETGIVLRMITLERQHGWCDALQGGILIFITGRQKRIL